MKKLVFPWWQRSSYWQPHSRGWRPRPRQARPSRPRRRSPAGPAPVAKADAISEIRGEFKWAMTMQQVMDKINARIEASYKDRIAKTNADPNRNDRLRKAMRDEMAAIKKNIVKFEGKKGPWDVSIIDQESCRDRACHALHQRGEIHSLLLLRQRQPVQDVHRL